MEFSAADSERVAAGRGIDAEDSYLQLLLEVRVLGPAAQRLIRDLSADVTLLSPKEIETLQALADTGYIAKAAEVRGVKLETVRTQLRMIRMKLGARNGAHCVAIAYRLGLIR